MRHAIGISAARVSALCAASFLPSRHCRAKLGSLISVVLLLSACGGTSPGDDAGGGGSDSGAIDAPMAGPPTHDCEEADFVDRTGGDGMSRTIGVGAGAFVYTPSCMTIRAGQSLTFAADFATHPLAPGVAPGHPGTSTTPTPIAAQSSGTTYTVTFPDPGDYAYHCTVHYHSSGMYGVVRVVP